MGADAMTKAELVARIADQTQLTRQQITMIVDIFLQCIIDALRGDDKVELRGFGSFRCRHRQPRTGRNPKTGMPVQVPAKTMPFFKASKAVQENLNAPEPVSPQL
jgi:integration host factor subunit beta